MQYYYVFTAGRLASKFPAYDDAIVSGTARRLQRLLQQYISCISYIASELRAVKDKASPVVLGATRAVIRIYIYTGGTHLRPTCLPMYLPLPHFFACIHIRTTLTHTHSHARIILVPAVCDRRVGRSECAYK